MTRETMENLITVLIMIACTTSMMIISAFVGDAEVASFIAVITIIMCGLAMVYVEEQDH